LENFSEVQLLLGQWHVVYVSESKQSLNFLTFLPITILTLIALGILILGEDPVLITVVGPISLIVLVSGFFLICSSSNYDRMVKRGMWWVWFPILLILVRLYFFVLCRIKRPDKMSIIIDDFILRADGQYCHMPGDKNHEKEGCNLWIPKTSKANKIIFRLTPIAADFAPLCSAAQVLAQR
jgi:hypothetical protein